MTCEITRPRYTEAELRTALVFAREIRAVQSGLRVGTFTVFLRRHPNTCLISRRTRLLLLMARAHDAASLVACFPREILLMILTLGRASKADFAALDAARSALAPGSLKKRQNDTLESQVMQYKTDPADLYRFLLLE